MSPSDLAPWPSPLPQGGDWCEIDGQFRQIISHDHIKLDNVVVRIELQVRANGRIWDFRAPISSRDGRSGARRNQPSAGAFARSELQKVMRPGRQARLRAVREWPPWRLGRKRAGARADPLRVCQLAAGDPHRDRRVGEAGAASNGPLCFGLRGIGQLGRRSDYSEIGRRMKS
ncbi:hypothetical protein F2981_02535 [Sinorhizobium meliloti]|nr:hypothetical protein [Sinorhizobium meliloti]